MQDLINQIKADGVTFIKLDDLISKVEALTKAEVAEVAEAVTGVKPAASTTKHRMVRDITKRVALSINTRRRMEDTQSIF